MTAPLPLISEDEVRRVVTPDAEDRSFGCLRCEQGVLPLKALHVGARIVGTFAHTTLRQTFVNNAGVPVEATYIFPLPDRAAVTRFVMEVAGRRVEGDLQERGQARQTYDRAISQGKRAAIAEEERPGTFNLRVGNLLPGEEAVITLEMTGPLPTADGEVTYRFPLVVAPRYIPGRPLSGDAVGDGVAADTDAVPDASRISPPVLLSGYPNPVRLSIEATIDPAGLPLSKVRSALHAAWADEAQGLLRVAVAAGERVNRDFILRFCLADATLRTTARATRFSDGKDDALLVTMVPPALSSSAVKSRDIVFVLDRSGSMEGWKMIAARRAVARMVDALRDGDRFSLLAFDDRVEAFAHGLTEASDRNRYKAVEWLAKVDSRGGTEMAMPLSQAADLLAGGYLDRDRVLVFVTDGQVGNEAQLLKLLGQRLRGSRVFALGIDQAVNAGFMNRLAALGGQGEAELVESEDRVDEVLTRCHRRIDNPELSEVSVDVEGGTLVGDSVAPSRLPDVFAGVPAVVVGRVRRHGNGSVNVVVRGRRRDGSRYEERVALQTTANPALLPAWARLHLRDLEDRFDGGKGNKGELERRIVQVSLESRVLCRFTAFVAVDHEVVNEGGRLHKQTQHVEAPAGWKGDVSSSTSMNMPSPPPPPRPGAPMSPRMAAQSAPMPSTLSAKSKAAAPAPSRRALSVDEESDSLSEIAVPAAEAFDDFDGGEGSFLGGDVADEPAPPPPPRARAGGPIGGLLDRAKDAVFGGGRADERVADKGGSKREEAKKMAKESSAPMKKPQVAQSESKPEPVQAPTTPTTTTTLAAYADRLRVLMDRIDRNEDRAAIIDELRLLIEEAAHQGIPPAVRKPLEDALRCLERGDVDGAKRALEPHAAKAGRGGFWR